MSLLATHHHQSTKFFHAPHQITTPQRWTSRHTTLLRTRHLGLRVHITSRHATLNTVSTPHVRMLNVRWNSIGIDLYIGRGTAPKAMRFWSVVCRLRMVIKCHFGGRRVENSHGMLMCHIKSWRLRKKTRIGFMLKASGSGSQVEEQCFLAVLMPT